MLIRHLHNFLYKKHCLRLIKATETDLQKCSVLGDANPNTRIAEGTWFKKNDPLVKKIVKKVSNITGYPIVNLERPHIVKYNVGGEYQPHHDFFHPEQDYFKVQAERGGQRVRSFLIYLNDDFSGGETEFPDLGVKIEPKRGKAIVWKNVNEKGMPEYTSLHAGLPVIEGVKYILVIWVREGAVILNER
jgi:prolyl 4-hydroxylase